MIRLTVTFKGWSSTTLLIRAADPDGAAAEAVRLARDWPYGEAVAPLFDAATEEWVSLGPDVLMVRAVAVPTCLGIHHDHK